MTSAARASKAIVSKDGLTATVSIPVTFLSIGVGLGPLIGIQKGPL